VQKVRILHSTAIQLGKKSFSDMRHFCHIAETQGRKLAFLASMVYILVNGKQYMVSIH